MIYSNRATEGFDKPTERVNFEVYDAQKTEFIQSK